MTILSVTAFIFATTILCGIIAIIVFHARRLRIYKMGMALPGPPALPIIGNALVFTGNNEDIMKKLIELSNAYPSPFRIWLGPFLQILVKDPEHLKIVLQNQNLLGKSEIYKFAEPWVGTGVVTGPVEKWRVHRKIMAPVFTASNVKYFVNIFTEQSKILVQQLEKHVDGPETDLTELVSMCTLDMICETAMGVKLKTQTGSYYDYWHALKRISNIVSMRGLKIWLYPNLIFNQTRIGKEHNTCVQCVHDLGTKIIKLKKKAYEKNDQADIASVEDHEINDERQKKAFLDAFLDFANSEKNLTDQDIREEVDTLIVAGHDTIARTLDFLMLMLASYPDIQERVYEELCEIYETDDDRKRDVNLEDTTRMEYLERVIKETMRLFPAIPIISRSVMKDTKIGNYTVPKGSSVAIGVFHVHRNEKIWPNPSKFDPDRFLPEEINKRHPWAFIPFSGGLRGCVGFKYAMVAMKIAAATILRNYILKKDVIVPAGDIRLEMTIFMETVLPLTLRIERRRSPESSKTC